MKQTWRKRKTAYFVGKRLSSADGIAANHQEDSHVVIGGHGAFIHSLGPLWSNTVSLKLLETDFAWMCTNYCISTATDYNNCMFIHTRNE
jgi:hypothetical protein